MKKLFLLFLLLAFALPVNAFNPLQVCTGAVASGGTCTGDTVQFEETTRNDFFQVGLPTTTYLSNKFKYTGTTGALCRIDLYLTENGTNSGDVTVYLYDDSSGEPGSVLATIGTIDATTITPTTYVWYDFSGVGTSAITNDGIYHIVLKYTGTSSDYLRWGIQSACTTESMYSSTDATTWATWSTVFCGNVKLYIKE